MIRDHHACLQQESCQVSLARIKLNFLQFSIYQLVTLLFGYETSFTSCIHNRTHFYTEISFPLLQESFIQSAFLKQI